MADEIREREGPSLLADRVSQSVREIEELIVRYAHTTGVVMTDWRLRPTTPFQLDRTDLASISKAEMLLVGLANVGEALNSLAFSERITVEHRVGRWGLWYEKTDRNAPRSNQPPVALKDAPLDVREAFLSRSQEFVTRYFEACDLRQIEASAALDTANAAKQMLQERLKGLSSPPEVRVSTLHTLRRPEGKSPRD